MTNIVGTARVRIELDEAGATAQARRVGDQISDSLTDAVSNAGAELQSALGRAPQAIGDTLAAGFNAAAIAAGALGAATLAAGVSFNTLSQSVTAGLTAVLGTRDAANDLIGEVVELNQTAALSRQAWLGATQQLAGFGVAASDIPDVLRGIEDAVLAVGGGEEEFARLVETLAQAETEGRFTGEAFQQLATLGINPAKIAAEQLGITIEEADQQLRNGQITVAQFSDLLSGRFAGAVETYADTWDGALGRVQAALRNIGAELTEPFIDPQAGGAAIDLLNAIADAFYEIAGIEDGAVTGPLSALLPVAESAATAVTNLADRINEFTASLSGADLDGFTGTLQDLVPLIAAVGAGLTTMFASNISFLAPFLAGFNPIVVAVGVLVATVPEARAVFGDLLSALAPLVPVIADVAATLGSGLASAIGGLATAISPVIDFVGVLVDVFMSLPSAIQGVVVALGVFKVALAFTGPIGAAVVAISALASAMDALVGASDEVKFSLAEVEQAALNTQMGRQSEIIDTVAAANERLNETYTVLGVSIAQSNLSIISGTQASNEYHTAIESLDAGLAALVGEGNVDQAAMLVEQLASQMGLSRAEMRQLIDAEMPQYSEALLQNSVDAEQAAVGQQGLSAAQQQVAEAARLSSQAVSALDERLQTLIDRSLGAEAASDAQQRSLNRLKDAAQAAAENGRTLAQALRGQSNTALDNRAALRQLVDQTGQMIVKDAELAGSTKEAESAARGHVSALRDELRNLGLTKAQADRYVSSLDNISGEYLAEIVATATNLDTVEGQLDNVARERTAFIRSVYGGTPPPRGTPLPRADGGIFSRPELALIGEAGTEVLLPLTRPQRAMQLAQESGLLDMLAGAMTGHRSGGGTVKVGSLAGLNAAGTGPRTVQHHTHHWNINHHGESDEVFANRLGRRFTGVGL